MKGLSPVPAARPGFSVAEVMAAVVVLAVALTGASFMMTSAFGTYRNQDRSLVRQALTHDQMESIAATHYPTLKAAIAGARRPTDPQRPDLPPETDFESVSGGEAIVNFEIAPPKDDKGEWKPAPKEPQNNSGQFTHGSKTYTPNMDATLRLQYWDPQFDTPSMVDKGLIRAKFSLSDHGVQTEAVRYVTR